MKKKREVSPAKEISEKESGRELLTAEDKTERISKYSAIFALLCCVASLYMQHQYIAIFCFCVSIVLQLGKLPSFLEKYGAKIFMVVSALIFCFGIATRIVMYAKGRTLWNDEAWLAESIVARNWAELLASPLSNTQSAPILYVITVKAICSVLGYSEFSLRVFSLISCMGLLVCEWIFLKKVLNVDNIKTAFVLIITAVVPSYVYYSNELKPYMGDAFFVVLALLLYAFYTRNKISLIKLTVFYVLILGFSTPAIFFIGGILAAEFFDAALTRNKKLAIYVLISGLSVVALFGLYYYWWMLPNMKSMDEYWNKSPDKSAFNALFIVMTLLLYFLYTRKKLPLLILTVFYMLILVFCPPAVFFVVGILVGELLTARFARNRKQLISFFASLLSIAALFGLCYQLRTSFVSQALDDFWSNTAIKTELITSVKKIFSLDLLDCTLIWVLVPFMLLGIYSLIKQKNKVAYSVVLSILLISLASSIGRWPLNGRLWLFLPAVVLIFSSVGYDLISKGNNIVLRKITFCLFSAITVFYAISWIHQWPDDDIFVPKLGEEVTIAGGLRFANMRLHTDEGNPLIKYVEEHIKDDEKLYVYPPARSTVMFKTGYKNRIGQTDKDNIIYGIDRNKWNEDTLSAELDTIIKSRKTYLLFQHYWSGIDRGLAILQQYGTVNLIWVSYNTPLFYFEVNE
ncbi:MAG: hypothetical protein LBC59_03795 [Chitinispirillales bacterium]|jgi:hypothetical protein|nr:hypothetical protein [Chitinispirillales bacterium]